MSQRTLITDMQANQLVQGLFAVQNVQLGMTRNGKPFLKCLLCDKSGRAPARMWNATEQLVTSLPTDGFVYVEGQTQPYQGEMQIIIQSIAAADKPSAAELADLVPVTPFDIDDMFAELKAVLGTIDHAGLKALADNYLDDSKLMSLFRQAPAAMQLHHAYLGGLLEHTLQLLRLADVVCPLYREINRDVVLMGLFLHDLGKCVELHWDRGFGYTDEGQLVGHIAQGAIWLSERAKQVRDTGADLPDALVQVLQHIILSHHGRPEYGALKLPATPEAILVSLLDNVDAKMHMAIGSTRNPDGSDSNPDMGGNFTEKIWALETRLFRPDPTRAVDARDESEPQKPGKQAAPDDGRGAPEKPLRGGL